MSVSVAQDFLNLMSPSLVWDYFVSKNFGGTHKSHQERQISSVINEHSQTVLLLLLIVLEFVGIITKHIMTGRSLSEVLVKSTAKVGLELSNTFFWECMLWICWYTVDEKGLTVQSWDVYVKIPWYSRLVSGGSLLFNPAQILAHTDTE